MNQPWWVTPNTEFHGIRLLARNNRVFRISQHIARWWRTFTSAWMDNTTIVTACALMSEEGPKVMTPLTVWDVVTFVRAVVCYERIYHHEHPDIDEARVNQLLGGDVFKSVPLPTRAIEDGRLLPDPWDGAHRFMCETWEQSFVWLN